jgi:hypothetical protein
MGCGWRREVGRELYRHALAVGLYFSGMAGMKDTFAWTGFTVHREMVNDLEKERRMQNWDV